MASPKDCTGKAGCQAAPRYMVSTHIDQSDENFVCRRHLTRLIEDLGSAGFAPVVVARLHRGGAA